MVSISTIFPFTFLGSRKIESISYHTEGRGGWDTRPVLIWRALQCWCQSNLIISCGIFDLWRKHNDNCLHPEQEGQTPLNEPIISKIRWLHTKQWHFCGYILDGVLFCLFVSGLMFFLVLARRHLQHTSFSWCATAICDYSSPILIGRKNGLVCNNKSFFLFYLLRLRQLTLIFFI